MVLLLLCVRGVESVCAGHAVGPWMRSGRSPIPVSHSQPWNEVNIQGKHPALLPAALGDGSAPLPCIVWVKSLSAFPR